MARENLTNVGLQQLMFLLADVMKTTYNTKHQRVRDAQAKATRRAADTPTRTDQRRLDDARVV